MPSLLTFTNVIFLFDVAVKGNTSHKKSVLQKAFQEFGAVLSSACNFNKNVNRHMYFSWILIPQVENSFFVHYAQHQWLLLERYTHQCKCQQLLFWPSHKNIIPSIFTL